MEEKRIVMLFHRIQQEQSRLVKHSNNVSLSRTYLEMIGLFLCLFFTIDVSDNADWFINNQCTTPFNK